MNMHEQREAVINVIRRVLKITPGDKREKSLQYDNHNIYCDLDADSLGQVELVMAMEEEFDLEISDAAAEKLTTIGDFVNYVALNT